MVVGDPYKVFANMRFPSNTCIVRDFWSDMAEILCKLRSNGTDDPGIALGH